MQTVLPTEIKTVDEAKTFLKSLHDNGEAYHPEDDANSLWSEIFTKEEGDALNKLMEQIYNIGGFDPCEYLNELGGHVMED